MSNSQLWKYCTKEQCQDFILSLDLVPHSAGMSREKQLACLYMLSNRGAENYHKEILTKKDGGTRTLMVPCSLLKAVQRNILHHVLEQRPVSDCARAYRKGTDILANAGPHTGRKQVLKLDISHFFDSILFPRVISAAFPDTLFPPAAAALLANLLPGTPAPGLSGFSGHLQSGDAPL